ncbi:MAG: ATP synthase subunit I [Pseudomonadales bacterium]|nr:ATP synthase subunit I [Pseudomonadales bacterium]
MMNEIMVLVLVLLAGMGLGLVFFGGLWLTVGKIAALQQPGLWFFTSWLLRMTFVLGGIYWIGNGQWQRILICMAGFIAGRMMVFRRTSSWRIPKFEKGDRYAP